MRRGKIIPVRSKLMGAGHRLFDWLGTQLTATRRSVLRRAVISTATANVVSVALGSLGGLMLARGLGPTGRGEFAIAWVWPSVVGMLATIGLPQATCYWVSRDPEERDSYLSTCTLLVAVIAIAVGLVGYYVSSQVAAASNVIFGLKVFFLTAPLQMVPAVWAGALQATNVRLWNIVKVIQPIGYVVGLIAITAAGALTVKSAVIVLVISLGLRAIGGVVFVGRCFGRWTKPRGAVVRPLFQFGSKSIAAQAPLTLNARLDQLVLSVVVPSTAVGQYALAFSLSQLATPFTQAFGEIAFPSMAASRAGRQEKIKKQALAGSLVVALLVLLPLMLAAPWLIPTIFGAGFSAAVPSFLILAPAGVILAMNRVSESVLRGQGDPFPAAIGEAIGALGTVILLLLLVPRLGIEGAALASLFSYSLVLVFLWRKMRNK